MNGSSAVTAVASDMLIMHCFQTSASTVAITSTSAADTTTLSAYAPHPLSVGNALLVTVDAGATTSSLLTLKTGATTIFEVGDGVSDSCGTCEPRWPIATLVQVTAAGTTSIGGKLVSLGTMTTTTATGMAFTGNLAVSKRARRSQSPFSTV